MAYEKESREGKLIGSLCLGLNSRLEAIMVRKGCYIFSGASFCKREEFLLCHYEAAVILSAVKIYMLVYHVLR